MLGPKRFDFDRRGWKTDLTGRWEEDHVIQRAEPRLVAASLPLTASPPLSGSRTIE
jgi:hypothetical protein